LAETLDHLLGITDRGKELRHRDDLTEEERAEWSHWRRSGIASIKRSGSGDSRLGDKKAGSLMIHLIDTPLVGTCSLSMPELFSFLAIGPIRPAEMA
jgi:hypothetical protein